MADPFPILEASALVVAHPDDEVLWFSSILAKVELGIVCYEDCDELPELGPGRRSAMASYPLSSVTWLRRSEPCSLGRADWARPLQTPYGMALNAEPFDPGGEARYRSSYDALREELRERLRGSRHVFTHNPWGEYGHPDHVQVSRVLAGLRPELGFRLFYSNYVSPRSMAFAAQFLPELATYVRLPTDPALVAEIKALYQANQCWTWHPEHRPGEDEAFIEDTEEPPGAGASVPLNCVMP